MALAIAPPPALPAALALCAPFPRACSIPATDDDVTHAKAYIDWLSHMASSTSLTFNDLLHVRLSFPSYININIFTLIYYEMRAFTLPFFALS